MLQLHSETNNSAQAVTLPNKLLSPKAIEEFLASLIAEKTNAAILNLDNNCLELNHIHQLARLLELNTSITTLFLRNTHLNDEKLFILSQAIGKHPTLETLYIDNNEFTEEGFAILIDQLKTLTRLFVLCVSYNERLGIASANKIAELLSVSQTIQALYLSRCSFGHNGLQAILENCVRHPSLAILSLKFTSIDEQNAEYLKNIIKNNPKIISVHIDVNNDISDETKASISALTEKNFKEGYPIKYYQEYPETEFPKLKELCESYLRWNKEKFKETCKLKLPGDLQYIFFAPPRLSELRPNETYSINPIASSSKKDLS